MSDQRIPSQWQLQNTGESQEQWMLHEEEQSLPSHMQLSQQPGQGYDPYQAQQGGYQYQGQYAPDNTWQPIDYRAMQQAAQRPSNRSGVILGALLVVALLSVGGYLAWFYAGQPELPGLTSGATPESAQAVLPVETPAPVEEATPPTAEVVAPAGVIDTPTPEPTLAPTATPYLVEIRRVTVNSEFGVNAREAASADAVLIELLENGTNFLVASGPIAAADGSQWYEIVLTDNERAFVIAEFVTPVSEFIDYADAAPILTAAGLPAPPAPVVESTEPVTSTGRTSLGAALTATQGITTSADITATTPATDTATEGGVAAAESITGTEAVTTTGPAPLTTGIITVSATISAPAGVNLRGAPETGENVLRLLEGASAVSIIGRSADGEWLQVQADDGTRGWVSAPFVQPAAALDAIPLGTTQPLTPTLPLNPIVPPQIEAPTAVTTTTPTTAATPVTTTAPAGGTGLGALGLPTPTPSAGTSATITDTAPTTTTASLPTPTPAAPAGVEVIVVQVVGTNLRPEPSEDSTSTTALEWQSAHTAIGRTADNAWIQVVSADGETGWVSSSAVMVTGGPGVLPVVQ